VDRPTRARWLAWTSCVCLSLAVYVAVASIWLPVMGAALALASVGLALMLAAVVLLVLDRRGRRR
jgi:Mn2+/Fe2+ NRAMP family transporter